MSNLATPHAHRVDHITAWFEALLQKLDSAHQRVLVSCQGTEGWCDAMVDAVIPQCRSRLILSDRKLSVESVPFAKSETLLGQEAHVVIVDLFRGLNPDVIGIAGGLVKSPGILLLISEKPKDWARVDDQYAIWQNQSRSDKALFVDYFFDQIHQKPDLAFRLLEGEAPPALLPFPVGKETAITNGRTAEQETLIGNINSWLRHPEQRIALITANRGRGKSTGLGFIAAELVNRHKLSICVTAYSRQSASMLLQQFEASSFVSPDQLIESPVAADVLIIDEAAMLPYPMLAQLNRRYKRVIMATTTGGYEGTGGGFLLRFVSRLPSAQLLRLELIDPVRWSANDCLENWLDEILLLAPNLPESRSVQADLLADSSRFSCRVLERDESQQDINLLLKIYRLMVSAHYRTRPSDLRALMENPDLVLVLAELDGELLGVALLNREGGFDTELCHQVFLGQRRPKGHLLAQTLTAQAGAKKFAQFHGLRVQRIAVDGSWRRQGIGRRLMSMAEGYARQHSCDYIGASFAFDSQASGFWRNTGFQLVHIGFGQGKSSGSHSVAVIRALTPLVNDMTRELMTRIQNGLSLWLCQYLQAMDVETVVALIRYCQYSTQFSDIEIDEIKAFTEGHKGFELCFASLQRFVMQSIAGLPENRPIHPWVIEKVVQNRDWKNLSLDADRDGRKSVQNQLRELIRNLSLTEEEAMYQDLIDFWFSEEVSRYWFNSTKEFDRQLRDNYSDLWQQAAGGLLSDWQETASGSLALVILLDQFPLNMFRGEARCFSTEAQSREVAQAAIDRGFDIDMPTKQKAFLYMPFKHSESLDDQSKALQLFDQPGLEDNYRFAKHHYGIVERFGRFPHRNAILGRESSEAEIEYLNSKEGFQG